jgi:hypothetical protein
MCTMVRHALTINGFFDTTLLEFQASDICRKIRDQSNLALARRMNLLAQSRIAYERYASAASSMARTNAGPAADGP